LQKYLKQFCTTDFTCVDKKKVETHSEWDLNRRGLALRRMLTSVTNGRSTRTSLTGLRPLHMLQNILHCVWSTRESQSCTFGTILQCEWM